jgi:hypothetical protein
MNMNTKDQMLENLRRQRDDLLAASRAIEALIWEYGIGDSDRVVEPVVARFREAIRAAEGEAQR